MAVEVVTFGCRLNTYESEAMQRHAQDAGLGEVVIVNTCAVTAEATRQARQSIRKLAREKPNARIVVTGCAAQVEPETFAAMPEVSQVVGNHEKMKAETWAGMRDFGVGQSEKVLVNDIMAVKETAVHLIDGMRGRTRAFVQVQNGCDHRCTFCIIPYGRGNSRSVPMGVVVEQVRTLVEHGSREVVLTGVDITSYGKDLPGEPKLGTLVKSLLRHVPELERLRISSIDSVEADDDLLDVIATESRLMPHLHLSLQAGDDMVLKRMKRRHLRNDAIAFCEEVKRLRPDMVFGADIIAGFPTEDRRDVRALPRHRRGMRADASPRLPLLAPPRHAGRAHAAGRPRRGEGPGAAPARKGRGGFAEASRRGSRRTTQRADRVEPARPHGGLYARALRQARDPGRDRAGDHCRPRRQGIAGGMTDCHPGRAQRRFGIACRIEHCHSGAPQASPESITASVRRYEAAVAVQLS